ncbi:hypothetical protein [Sessilibacter corallicola]|uniref:ECF transporter S component n=2 Tax=Sessilibacter corallicola TaxID=2904075 RepID=A0ABQ0A830_9GAMM
MLLIVLFAPWRAFFSVSQRVLLWLFYAFSLASVWLLEVKVADVFSVHLSMMTAAVFLFGFRLAILAGVFGLFAHQLVSPFMWDVLGLNFLLTVVMPAVGTYIALKIVALVPINNLFVFILGGGFFGAILSVLVTVASGLALFGIFNAWSLTVVIKDHLWLYGMSLFPEGFINGAIVSTTTVLWPHLVKTYDDHRYLDDS